MKWLKWLGRILSITCLIFLGIRLYSTSTEIQYDTFEYFDILIILIVIIAMSFLIYFNVYPWKKILEFLENKKTEKNGFAYFAHIYTKSNLAKYLPGNVMHYVSRTLLAKQYGFSSSNTVLSIVLETGMIILTAAIVALFFLRKSVIQIIQFLNFSTYLFMAGVVLLAIFIGYILSRQGYGKTIVEALRAVCSVDFLKQCIKPFAFYVVNFLITAAMFYIILLALTDMIFSIDTIVTVSGVYIISWLLGYITPGASGGIGIRETVLLFLMVDYYSESEILTSAIVFRVITIIADVVAYLLGIIILKLKAKINLRYKTS